MKEQHNLHFENLDLQDIEGEFWVDAFGYDGLYQVSNLGRIKSLQREVVTRWGTTYLKKEMISKQSIRMDNNRVDGLIVSILKKSFNVGRFIFTSFYPQVDFLDNECVMHINKIVLDNRIENLEKVQRKVSKQVDMVKSKPTIAATHKNLEKANLSSKNYYDSRTHRECIKCGKSDLIENFPEGVNKCQPCLNKYNFKKRAEFKYTGVEKKCNRCQNSKPDIEFPKRNNTCKKCSFEIHKEYQLKQSQTLGDWYVKEYGKRTRALKVFSEETLTELRKEIRDKRELKNKTSITNERI